MEIIHHNHPNFWENWHIFVATHRAPFCYLSTYIRYLKLSLNFIQDQSFILIENNQPQAICFLPILVDPNYYLYAPLATTPKFEKACYAYIDEIAQQHALSQIKFQISPFLKKYIALARYQYHENISREHFLDLTLGVDNLLKNIRKGHRADIKKLLSPDYALEIYDSKNPDYAVHEAYRELHHRCAGRVTRAKASFDQQFEMLQHDHASLVGLKFKQQFIGFNYFFHGTDSVLYASGADNPDYAHLPIYHSLLWHAIQYYAQRGFKDFSFSAPSGFNLTDGFDDNNTEKQLRIAQFKRGFGGEDRPVFRGIKYYATLHALVQRGD